MQKMKRVKKLVSQISLSVFGTALLLANVAFAVSVKSKSSKNETTGRIREGSVVKKAPNNYLSLKEFNTELKNKVQEHQLVAAFTSIENTDPMMVTKANGAKSMFSGGVSVSYAESLVDHKDGSKQASQTAKASLAAQISDHFSVAAEISATQDMHDHESLRDNGVSDLAISLSQKRVKLTDWLKGGFNLTTVLPVSEYSRKFQNFQGAIGASYSFSLTDLVLPMGIKTSLTLGASRSFHEFETDAAGKILNPYGLKEILSGSYEIKDFAISVDLLHRHAWNYKGSVSESFEHSEEIGYSITKQLGVALGHTNAGSWLTPNGRDSNLKLINDDDSIIYGSMSLMF